MPLYSYIVSGSYSHPGMWLSKELTVPGNQGRLFRIQERSDHWETALQFSELAPSQSALLHLLQQCFANFITRSNYQESLFKHGLLDFITSMSDSVGGGVGQGFAFLSSQVIQKLLAQGPTVRTEAWSSFNALD